MDKAKARIAYVGGALDNGSIDVRDLAPALIAFSDLVENINSCLNGKGKIRVLLNQDSMQRGSIDVTLYLESSSILESAKLFMGFAEETGLKDLIEILGWGGTLTGGIFALIKLVKGRKIKNIEHKPDNKVEITAGDDVIATDEKTLKVYLDVNCRLNIEKIIRPLQNEGVDAFELRNPTDKQDFNPIVSIRDSEMENFKAPAVKEIDDETFAPTPEIEIVTEIVTINFVEGKWKLNDGTHNIWVTIQDEDFKKRVAQREFGFAKGDMLKIRYHVEQAIKGGKLTTEYIVSKVLEVIEKPQQIELDFETQTESKDE